MAIETVNIPVRNGNMVLSAGDVFVVACDARFEGDGLKRYENSPIFENEVQIDLFVEGIQESGKWVDRLLPGQSAILHLVGYKANEITANKIGLKTKFGQYICIG